MRFALVLAALAVVSYAPLAAAEPPSSRAASDIGLLRECLDSGRDSCSGSVGAICLLSNSATGSRDWMITCTEREIAAWRVLIADASTRLDPIETRAQRTLRRRAIDDLEQSDESQCAYRAAAFDPVTARDELTLTQCQLELVATFGAYLYSRANELSDELENERRDQR